MQKITKQKGFNLIELMIVIAIIGILAAVALPQYQSYIARSQITEALNFIAPAKIKVFELYHQGELSANINTPASIGLTKTVGKYISQVTVASTDKATTITITFNKQSNSALRDKTLDIIIAPEDNIHSILCQPGATAGISDNLLPTSCKLM